MKSQSDATSLRDLEPSRCKCCDGRSISLTQGDDAAVCLVNKPNAHTVSFFAYNKLQNLVFIYFLIVVRSAQHAA